MNVVFAIFGLDCMHWANVHSLDHKPQEPIRILGKAIHVGWQEEDPVFFWNLWHSDLTGGSECVGAGTAEGAATGRQRWAGDDLIGQGTVK